MQIFPTLIYALAAVSGMSGLIYEVLWIRALGLHLGTSAPAVALVTATFMAGLATGNAWLGSLADRVQQPLALYRRIEAGIAVAGLAVSLVLLRGGSALDPLVRLSQGMGALRPLAHAWLLVLLLLVPTTLMGATLPVSSRALMRSGRASRTVGALYGCNTLGAVAGALLPDFWLIPKFGLTLTACVAAAGNLLVVTALGSKAVSRAALAVSLPPPSTLLDDESGRVLYAQERATRHTAFLLSAASGFAGLALEVLWSRTLEHWTAALVTSFSLLLAVDLGLLAFGALLTRRLADRAPQPLSYAATLVAMVGPAAILPVLFAPAWRTWQASLGSDAARDVERAGLAWQAFDALTHAVYLEGMACLLMGAAFPFLISAVVRQNVATSGARTGRLWMVNTLAAVLGSLAACFVGLPWLGQQNSYLVLAISLALVGSFAALLQLRTSFSSDASAHDEGPRAPIATVVGPVVSLGLVLGLAFWLPSGHLRRTYFRANERILALREGSTTTAAAAAQPAFGEFYFLALLTPGVSMSDTRFGTRRYMGMMAHAAMLAVAQPKRALLICYGAGNTARSLLSHPTLAHLRVVEISTEVLGLSPLFARVRGSDPLLDPRTQSIVDDGRHALIANEQRYDVITTEPPPPNHAGVVNLYSRQFYQLAKRRLQPRGVITQWLPVFQLSAADTHAMIAAFVAEFPHAALLYGQAGHFILIGSSAPLSIDPVLAARRMREPSVRRDLEDSGISGLAEIYGGVLQTDSELRKLVLGAAPLDDDEPSIQYPWQPRGESAIYAKLSHYDPARAQALLPRSNADRRLYAQIEAAARATLELLAVPAAQRRLESAPAERSELVRGNAVGAALRHRPGDEALLDLLALDAERATLAERALQRPGADALLAAGRPDADEPRRAQLYRSLQAASLSVARRAFYLGDYGRALGWLHKRSPTRDQRAQHELLLAASLRALGEPVQARTHFEAAIAASQDRAARAWLAKLARDQTPPTGASAGPFSVR